MEIYVLIEIDSNDCREIVDVFTNKKDALSKIGLRQYELSVFDLKGTQWIIQERQYNDIDRYEFCVEYNYRYKISLHDS